MSCTLSFDADLKSIRDVTLLAFDAVRVSGVMGGWWGGGGVGGCSNS